MTRTDSLFSDRFIAFWNYINKNSIDNSEIYSFKEYAESSNVYDENGDSKLSRRSMKNFHLKMHWPMAGELVSVLIQLF